MYTKHLNKTKQISTESIKLAHFSPFLPFLSGNVDALKIITFIIIICLPCRVSLETMLVKTQWWKEGEWGQSGGFPQEIQLAACSKTDLRAG